MAVLNPNHLLEQAELLLKPRGTRKLVRQADRRRAISSAYYAVFHFTLASLADEFVGKTPTTRRTPRYALVYRSVDHKALETLCSEVKKPKLPQKYEPYVPSNGFESNMREFAVLVLQLKEKRNSADYDPSHWVKIADARQAIENARAAIQRFGKASAARRKAFLTLLAFNPRP